MTWLLVTILAYFLLALVNLIDKLLIDRVLPSPKVYTALISLMGGLVIILAPWFLTWPGLVPWLWDLIAGAVFAVALWLMFESLKYGEASKVMVLIGSLIPVATLLWSLLVKQEFFSLAELVGLILLLIGALILVFVQDYSQRKVFKNFNLGLFLVLASSLVYATHFIMIKEAYDNQAFLSAFIWRGLGGAVAGLLFLSSKRVRLELLSLFNRKKLVARNSIPHASWLVVAVQACGALGFLLQSYAISLKSVVVINAMQGTQYLLLFLLAYAGTKLWPKWFHEDFSRLEIAKKLSAIALTAMGIILLSVG